MQMNISVFVEVLLEPSYSIIVDTKVKEHLIKEKIDSYIRGCK
jgi:hypothetical protein